MPIQFGPNPIVKAMFGAVELPQLYLGDVPLLGGEPVFANAAIFNGANSQISGANGTALDVAQQWAVSAWIKPYTDTRGGIVNGFSSATYSDSLYFDVNEFVGFQFYHIPSATNYIYRAPAGSVPVGVWTHIYVECNTFSNRDNPGWIRIWINGVEVTVTLQIGSGTTLTSYGSVIAYGGEISQRIGNHYNGNGWFNGEMAQVHVVDVGAQKFWPGVDAFGKDCGGTWKAIKYLAGHGSSGYAFEFDNPADLSEDSSDTAYTGFVAANLVASSDGPELCPPAPPIKIAASAMFDAALSTYHYRQFTNAARDLNDFIKTHAFWVKRTTLGQQIVITSSQASTASNLWFIGFGPNNELDVYAAISATQNGRLITTKQFTEVDKWMHVVVAVNTNKVAAADRVKIYVDGERITDFATAAYPAKGASFCSYFAPAGAGTYNYLVGTYWNATLDFDGLLSDVIGVDGYQLEPEAFGMFDEDGQWMPIDFAGPYGNNGMRIQYLDDTNIGLDTGPNGFDHTLFNMDAGNQFKDTPSNNCCSWDWNFGGGTGFSITKGATDAAPANVAGRGQVRGTFAIPFTGKWYFELTPSSLGSSTAILGLVRGDVLADTAVPSTEVGIFYAYQSDGKKWDGGAISSNYGATYTNDDVIGCMVDADLGRIEFTKNGVSQGEAWTGLDFSVGYFSTARDWQTGGSYLVTIESGQRGLANLPAGYLPLIKQNFPAPAIDPRTVFKANNHVGTGAPQSIVTGLDADFVWLKNRNGTNWNNLYDKLRGPTKVLYSNENITEGTDANGLTAFNADGFTVGSGASVNANNADIISWNFKNSSAFKVLQWTGNGVAGRALPHGMDGEPDMLIVKRTNTAISWPVYHRHKPDPELTSLFLDLAGISAARAYWNSQNPDDTNIYLGSDSAVNLLNAPYICYAFRSVPGVCKVGSFVGNGNADGPLINCGFRPRYIMHKNNGQATSWVIFDTTRQDYNPQGPALYTDLDYADNPATRLDILDTGFKIRSNALSTNGNNNTIIYLAFA